MGFFPACGFFVMLIHLFDQKRNHHRTADAYQKNSRKRLSALTEHLRQGFLGGASAFAWIAACGLRGRWRNHRCGLWDRNLGGTLGWLWRACHQPYPAGNCLPLGLHAVILSGLPDPFRRAQSLSSLRAKTSGSRLCSWNPFGQVLSILRQTDRERF